MDDIFGRFGIDKPTKSTGSGLMLLLRWLRRVYGVIRAELRSKSRLPLRHTLRAWRYGFSQSSYFLYELDRHDPRLFINSRVQFDLVERINRVP